MITCKHCYKNLPDDAKFCIYCGKPLKQEVKRNENSTDAQLLLKENERQNYYAKLGVFLFLIALIGFDFILGTVVQALGGNFKIVFYVSLIIYFVAIGLGILSIFIDRKDKKSGFRPTGNIKFSILSIVMSLYIVILNITQVIMK